MPRPQASPFPPSLPPSPAAHVVIPEQNLLPQIIPLQPPREFQSGELISQKLRVDKGLGGEAMLKSVSLLWPLMALDPGVGDPQPPW